MHLTRRTALGASIGTAILSATACGDDSASSGSGGGSTTAAGGGEDLSDVLYEGEATDEALEELLASEVVDDAAKAAAFVEPAAGTTLDPATVLTFSWSVGPTALRAVPAAAPAPSAPSVGGSRIARRPSRLERVVGVVLGVREAHAHGDPVNGSAFLLVFATASNPKLLRVFTTELAYTPDTAAWATLTGAGEGITATITSAVFEQNRVAPDGGPYLSAGLALAV